MSDNNVNFFEVVSSGLENISLPFAAFINRDFGLEKVTERRMVSGLGRDEIGKFKYYLSGLCDKSIEAFIVGTEKYFGKGTAQENSEMLKILNGILDGEKGELYCSMLYDRMDKNLQVSSARDHSADRRHNYENGGSIMQELVWALGLHLWMQDPDYRFWTDFQSRMTLPTWSETPKTRKKWNEFVEIMPYDDQIKDQIRVDENGFCLWNMVGRKQKEMEPVKKGYMDTYKTFEETHNVFKDEADEKKYYEDLIKAAAGEDEDEVSEPSVNEAGLKSDIIDAIRRNVKGVPASMIDELIKQFGSMSFKAEDFKNFMKDDTVPTQDANAEAPVITVEADELKEVKDIKDDLKDATLTEEAKKKNAPSMKEIVERNNALCEGKTPQLKKLGDMLRKEGFTVQYREEVPQYPGLIPVSVTRNGYTKNLLIDPGKIYGDTFRLITQDRKDGNVLKECFISFSDKNKELIIAACTKEGLTTEQRRGHWAPLARGTESVIERTDMSELAGNLNFGTWRSIVSKLASLYNQIPGVRFRLTNVKDKDNFELICDDKVGSCVNNPIFETPTHAWAFQHGLKVTFKPDAQNGYTVEYLDGTPIDFKVYPDPVKENVSPIEAAQNHPQQIVTESM